MTEHRGESTVFVRDLPPARSGQTVALYRRGDEHIVVSTVTELRYGDGGARDAILDMTSTLGAALGQERANSGEETMAFRADATGHILDWTEIAVANGEGSRGVVLAELGVDGG